MSKKMVRKYGRSFSFSSNMKKNLNADLTLSEMFNRFMLYKETEALTKITLNDYYKHFHYLMEFLDCDLKSEEITLNVFRAYIGNMLHEKGLSPVTVNVRVRTMRAFLRHCFMEGWIEEPIHERFKPVRAPEDTIESFTPSEVKTLLKAINDTSYKGFRDTVIIYVLLDTMVRCSELIQMRRANVDLKNGSIQLEPHETKTKRARSVPLSSKCIKLLKEYMALSSDFESEYLFLTYEGGPLADNTVRKNLQEWGKIAGVNNKRVSPHTFRHTAALFYIMNGGDPFSLQKILGHSDMSMVRKYIQMTDTDVKRQHNLFSPLKNI